jgi:hypothetical protein
MGVLAEVNDVSALEVSTKGFCSDLHVSKDM